MSEPVSSTPTAVQLLSQQLRNPLSASPPQQRALLGTLASAPMKGQLLTELVKRVRANPVAIAQYGLEDYVRSLFTKEDDMVRSVTVPWSNRNCANQCPLATG